MIDLSTDEKLAVLCAAPAFRSLDDAARRAFAEMLETECFRMGEEVCSFGEFDDRVMIIASGSLSVSLPGVCAAASALGRGDIIGEYGLVVGLRRTASIATLESSTLLSIDYERFTDFLRKHPGVLIYLFERAVTRLLLLEAKVREHALAVG